MGLNLVMLAERQCLYLPMKSALNDPTDCEPHIVVDHDLGSLTDALRTISTKANNVYSKVATRTLSQLDDASFTGLDPYEASGEDGKGTPLAVRAYNTVRNFIRSQIGMPRVFSMSGAWDIPQMWSYYADSHRGFCLELSGFPTTDSDFLFERVNYADKRP